MILGHQKSSSIVEQSQSVAALETLECATNPLHAETASVNFVKKLVTSPFTDWSNIGAVMEKYQKSMDHANTSQYCISFTSIASGKQQSVYQSISSAYQETIRRNRHVLGEIVKVIVLCGRQNISLRGHIPERSNFHSILNLLREHDPILDNFLKASPRHAQYISPQIHEFI